MPKKEKIEHIIEVAVHILVWAYIFGSPLLFHRRSEAIDWTAYLQKLYFPLTTCFIFYMNYSLLVPRLFLKKQYKAFLLYNLALTLLLTAGNEYFMYIFPPPMIKEIHGGHQEKLVAPMFLNPFFILRNLTSLIFITVVSVAIRLSMQWKRTEAARQEAELRRSEAELTNLKNQINPHFLLNTLNNIYALTVFDTEKAQKAIQELGKMLRYILYENQTQFVSLQKEAEFIRNYVALMRLRLPQSVEVSVSISFPEQDNLQVAPLIFIPLVENAFKHGISPTQPSFIRISLTANDGNIHFTETNSNFPKTKSDKTPGGIGLQQVRKRLELSYPRSHAWHYGTTPDGSTYFSTIEICLTRE